MDFRPQRAQRRTESVMASPVRAPRTDRRAASESWRHAAQGSSRAHSGRHVHRRELSCDSPAPPRRSVGAAGHGSGSPRAGRRCRCWRRPSGTCPSAARGPAGSASSPAPRKCSSWLWAPTPKSSDPDSLAMEGEPPKGAQDTGGMDGSGGGAGGADSFMLIRLSSPDPHV